MRKCAWEEWKEDTHPISKNDLEETAEIAHTREATSYYHITMGEISALRTGMRAEKKSIYFYR
jgi:hypothetical protein